MSRKPELVLNHKWTIGISKDLNGRPDPPAPYLAKGDWIKVKTTNEFPQVEIEIFDKSAKQTFCLNGTVEDHYPPIGSGSLVERVVIKFKDTINNGNRLRILTIQSARFDKFHFPPSGCDSHLQSIAGFLDQAERQEACNEKNLIVWRVHNYPLEDDNPKNKIALGPPEPGQGTGSGGSD